MYCSELYDLLCATIKNEFLKYIYWSGSGKYQNCSH